MSNKFTDIMHIHCYIALIDCLTEGLIHNGALKESERERFSSSLEDKLTDWDSDLYKGLVALNKYVQAFFDEKEPTHYHELPQKGGA